MGFRVAATLPARRFQQHVLLLDGVHALSNDRPSLLKYFLNRQVPQTNQAIGPV